MDLIPIFILGSTVISLGFTVLLTRKASKTTENTLNELKLGLVQGLDTIRDELDPILVANSRAMGAISGLADDTKMEKALERRIGQDLLGQNEDIFELIQMAFPRVAEYIEDKPEAISKLLPRLNTLISDPEARKRLSLDGSRKSGDLSRIWSEERG